MKFIKNTNRSNKSIIPKPLATAYRYDQLNRLVEVAAFEKFESNEKPLYEVHGLTYGFSTPWWSKLEKVSASISQTNTVVLIK